MPPRPRLSAAPLLPLCLAAGPLGAEPQPAPVPPPALVRVAGLPSTPDAAPRWQGGSSSGSLRGTPMSRFGVVAPGCLYRSGQPDEAGYRWLVEQGVRSVVCLREGLDDEVRARAVGLKYLRLTIPDEGPPTDEQARQFLHFVRDSRNWPVLIHCRQGVGRTSTLAALARYAVDGWSMSAALHEARKYRPFKIRIWGEQRRWLNRWKDRFPAGEYHPSRGRIETAGVPVDAAIGGGQ